MPRKPATARAEVEAAPAIATQSSMNQAIWSICDILRRGNRASAMQYVPDLSWMLFLRILDEREEMEQEAAEAVGRDFTPSLEKPFRWRDWAAPEGETRKKLQNTAMGEVFEFVNDRLLPHLKGLERKRDASARQKVISEVLSSVDKVLVDTEKNFLDVLDKLDALRSDGIDDTHMFALSQAYEGLLLRMGEKNSDGGQFFTPREIIRAMVRVVKPKLGEKIYDPCCGTGGFLAQAYEHMKGELDKKKKATGGDYEALKEETFYGREKENLVYPIALANVVLHGIDGPHLLHGNALTGQVLYDGLFKGAPEQFDVVLTNPPFGGKEGPEAQTNFAFKTSATQVLFLQHVIEKLKDGGRCGIVLDEGVLFRNNEQAFVKTKQKLLDECDLYCIVSMPPGVFSAAGAGVKTNLLFFNKGKRTEKIWYYDLSDVKVGKKLPFTRDKMEQFFELLPRRADSEKSWTVTREEIEKKNYDLKAVNPNAKVEEDRRTPHEIIRVIEAKGKEVDAALKELRKLLAGE